MVICRLGRLRLDRGGLNVIAVDPKATATDLGIATIACSKRVKVQKKSHKPSKASLAAGQWFLAKGGVPQAFKLRDVGAKLGVPAVK